MKLLRQKSREYKGKRYYKYWVIIPKKVIEKLGWKVGDKLKNEVNEKKLTIEKKWFAVLFELLQIIGLVAIIVPLDNLAPRMG